ncbi:response regulator [Spirosoma aerophilum]
MHSKFSILIVDDDPLLSDILTQASFSGFPEASFTQVHSSKEAIAFIKGLEGYGPQLVLLDFYLQDNGNELDFLSFLRSQKETRYLPVVILTVGQSHANIVQAYYEGASSFTIKPGNFDAWVTYLSSLRRYWFKTVSIPKIKFKRMF